MANPREWAVDVSRIIAKAKVRADVVLRKIAFDVLQGVVMRTPVDTGRLRATWNVSLGTPQGGGGGSLEPAGATVARGARVIGQSRWGTSIYMVNHLPYAVVVEYGGYPNPVKRGTYVPAGRARYGITGPGYVKRSVGGYSKQAPRGMVRLTLQEVRAQIGRLVADA